MTQVNGSDSWIRKVMEAAGAIAEKARDAGGDVDPAGKDVAEQALQGPPAPPVHAVAGSPDLDSEAQSKLVLAHLQGPVGGSARARSVTFESDTVVGDPANARAREAAALLRSMTPEQRVAALSVDYRRDPRGLTSVLERMAEIEPRAYQDAMEAIGTILGNKDFGLRPEDRSFIDEVTRLSGDYAGMVQRDVQKVVEQNRARAQAQGDDAAVAALDRTHSQLREAFSDPRMGSLVGDYRREPAKVAAELAKLAAADSEHSAAFETRLRDIEQRFLKGNLDLADLNFIRQVASLPGAERLKAEMALILHRKAEGASKVAGEHQDIVRETARFLEQPGVLEHLLESGQTERTERMLVDLVRTDPGLASQVVSSAVKAYTVAVADARHAWKATADAGAKDQALENFDRHARHIGLVIRMAEKGIREAPDSKAAYTFGRKVFDALADVGVSVAGLQIHSKALKTLLALAKNSSKMASDFTAQALAEAEQDDREALAKRFSDDMMHTAVAAFDAAFDANRSIDLEAGGPDAKEYLSSFSRYRASLLGTHGSDRHLPAPAQVRGNR